MEEFAALVAAAKLGDPLAFTRLVDLCAEYLWSNHPGVEDDPLYSIRGFAQFCGGVSHYTVEAWLSKGLIVRTKILGRTMIRASERKKILNEGGKSRSPRSVSAVAVAKANGRRQQKRKAATPQ